MHLATYNILIPWLVLVCIVNVIVILIAKSRSRKCSWDRKGTIRYGLIGMFLMAVGIFGFVLQPAVMLSSSTFILTLVLTCGGTYLSTMSSFRQQQLRTDHGQDNDARRQGELVNLNIWTPPLELAQPVPRSFGISRNLKAVVILQAAIFAIPSLILMGVFYPEYREAWIFKERGITTEGTVVHVHDGGRNKDNIDYRFIDSNSNIYQSGGMSRVVLKFGQQASLVD